MHKPGQPSNLQHCALTVTAGSAVLDCMSLLTASTAVVAVCCADL
jgi:hypothetical protein